MSDPVVVFHTRSDIEATVVRGLLDSHGIDATLSSGASNSLFPAGVDGLGDVRLSVCAEDAEAAARLIASYRDDQRRGFSVPLSDEYDDLESAIGYQFRDRGLLEHALTHRSRANEDVTGGVIDNESLEFLGDAVLGLVVADMLFHRFPDGDEGQKSKMKAGLVSAATLAKQAAALDLGRYLLLGRGEEKSGGRRKLALLADTYEALIAALYLDGGIEAARRFIERELEPSLHDSQGRAMADDYKSALQEFVQGGGRPLPEYVVAEESGPAHRRLFRVDVVLAGEPVASGEGRTKKEAEQEAARQALARLTG